MDQREIERLRVIGGCTKMQTISWDDEMKLMDGVPYEIDFFQDFSGMLKTGEPALIVDTQITMQPMAKNADTYVSIEERQRTLELFKQADKCVKKERKREEKWKRKQRRYGLSKRERQRDAELFFEDFDEWVYSK